jgi:DNA-binding response OmpR family regulator
MANIVIAEDDQMLAEIYQTRLELAGYTCEVAHDGLTALNLIHTAMPDLVLLDLMMPQLSGDEVLARMRVSDWGKDIKVIILTNISESEAPLSLDDLKFERYIVKVNLSHNQLAEIVGKTLAGNTDTSTGSPQE